jgi:uncharacterized membrane protein
VSAISTALISLAVAAPLLEAGRVPVAEPIYRLLRLICHQLPSRSPMIQGSNAGLCFRCMAIYAALALGTVLPLSAVVRPFRSVFDGMPRLTLNQAVVLIASLLIILLTLDGLSPMLGWPPSTNPRRVVTGFLGGWAILSLLLLAREQ